MVVEEIIIITKIIVIKPLNTSSLHKCDNVNSHCEGSYEKEEQRFFFFVVSLLIDFGCGEVGEVCVS